MNEIDQATKYFEDAIKETDEIINDCSEDLKKELTEQKVHFAVALAALKKQIPVKAYYEYDDEFICPACNYEEDGYDVKTYKVCPECGQKLRWD